MQDDGAADQLTYPAHTMFCITHVINNLEVGGAEMSLLRLLGQTDPNRYDHRVISLIGDGPIGAELHRRGVSVTCLDGRRGRMSLGLLRRLRSCVRDANPDLIQSWMYHSNLAAMFALRGVGHTPLCWNIRHSLHALSHERWLTRRVIQLGGMLSKRADAIVFNSKIAMRQHSAIGYKARRMEWIPNGVDCEEMVPDPTGGWQFRESLGLDDTVRLIGCAARLHPMKGHETLVEAVAATNDPTMHLALIGRGCEAGGAAERFRAQLGGRLHLMGEQRPLKPLLCGLDCLVIASTWGEGFPNVLAEAMACGVPCVSTDVGDAALILDDSTRISPPGDSRALATLIATITGMSQTDRTAMVARDRASIIKRFPLVSMARRYESLWTDLIAERSRPA